MLTLYDNSDSGNAYKVRLVLAHLRLPCQRVELDTDSGATRTPEFLALNANGRIPVLEREDGSCLAESNAILCYLAEGPALAIGGIAVATAFNHLYSALDRPEGSDAEYDALMRELRDLEAGVGLDEPGDLHEPLAEVGNAGLGLLVALFRRVEGLLELGRHARDHLGV